ncbi:unnamed protein product [Ilex paraguariensis]|uniref:AT-hook motif nuclear-localized protein n=1 Tax=Ilex paraguariensis TaxID=185542 RepID=A0ABC8RZ11_9AQUA
MSGGESYEVQVQSSMHNVRLGYSGDGSAMYKPMVSSPSPTPTYQLTVSGVGGDGSAVAAAVAAPQPSINTSAGESMKRKRGRPRKYAPDGSMALTVKSTPPLSGTVQPPTPPSAATGAVSASSGKKRGRPFGSGRKHQVAALGSAGVGFTPHIITVKAGEAVFGLALGLVVLGFIGSDWIWSVLLTAGIKGRGGEVCGLCWEYNALLKVRKVTV